MRWRFCSEPCTLLADVKEDTHYRLLERIREAAVVLKSCFHARRVVLFGSLAHVAWFTPDSDVDLAVEGLSSDDYWRAWRVVEEIIGDRPWTWLRSRQLGSLYSAPFSAMEWDCEPPLRDSIRL
jgi:predicted nucleotidyltransferase